MSDPTDPLTSGTFPESYLSTEVSDRLIQQILDAFNREGLTPHQARQVLGRVRMPKADMPWIIYDHNSKIGSFTKALDIL